MHAGAVGTFEVVEVDDGTLAAGLPRMGRPVMSIEKAGFLARSKVSRRASVLLSVEIRKSIAEAFDPAGERDR